MSLAQLFFAKHPRRRPPVRRPRREAPRRRALAFEPLESRILLSATIVGVADADDVLSEVQTEIHDNLAPVAPALHAVAIDGDFLARLDLAIPTLLDTVTNPAEPAAPRLDALLDLAANAPGGAPDVNADGVDISDVFKATFLDAVESAFGGSSSVAGLAATMDAIAGTVGPYGYSVDGVTGALVDVPDGAEGTHQLRFTATFRLERTDSFDFDLGRNADLLGLGIDFSNPAALGGILPNVDATTAYEFAFAFGAWATLAPVADADPGTLGAQPGTMITGGDFFLEADGAGQGLSAGVEIDDTIAGFDLHVGFLDVTMTGGTLDLDAAATVQFSDQNGDGAISAAEAAATATVSTTGAIDGSLDVDVDPGLTIAGSLGAPSVELSGDPFAPGMQPDGTDDPRTAPLLSVTDFDDLLNFTHVGGDTVLGMIDQLGSWLDGLADSALFDVDIPFAADMTLADVLPLGDLLASQLGGLETTDAFGNVVPSFVDVQDLAADLGAMVDGAAVNATYDVATDELTFHVRLDHAFAGASAPIDFDLPLGSLAGVSSDLTVSLAAGAIVEFDLGIDLDDGVAGDSTLTGIREVQITGTSAPGPFVLASDAVFTLTLDPGEADEFVAVVTVDADDTDGVADGTAPNASLDDLVADLRAALGAIFYADDPDFPDGDANEADLMLGDVIVVQSVLVDTDADGIGDDTRLRFAQSGAARLTSFTLTDLSASADGALGFDDGQVAAVQGPSPDGVLDGDAEFQLTVGGGDAVTVTVPLAGADGTADNTSLPDLVDDLTAALGAAGLTGIVEVFVPEAPAELGFPAGTLSNRLAFRTTAGQSLRFDVAAGDPAEELGFQDGVTTAATEEPEALFIDNASITGEVTLSVAGGVGPDAEARFGFVGLQADDVSGSLTGTIDVDLVDPDGDGRIELAELFDGLGDDPLSLTDVTLDDLTNANVSGGGTLTLGQVSLLPDTFADLAATLGASPHLDITLGDFDDLGTLSVTPFDLGDVVDFADVDFGDLTAALGAFADLVAGFADIEALAEPLPLIGLSLSELVSYVDAFAEMLADVEGNPALVIQSLEQRLEQALGLPAGSPLVSLGLDNSSGPTVLEITFEVEEHFGDSLAVDIDLAELAAAAGVSLGDLVNLSGAANIEADVTGALTLHVGVELENPANLYVYGDSGLAVTAEILGENLTFVAGIGPLGLYVQNGEIAIDADGDPNTAGAASFVVDLPGGVSDRIALGALDLGDAGVSVTAGAGGTLPMFFPTPSSFIGNLEVLVGDLGQLFDGDPDNDIDHVELPEFGDLLENLSLLDGLPLLIDGLDAFLGAVQELLDGEVLGIELPLVGDTLADGADFIQDFRDDVIDELRDVIENAPDRAFELVQQAIFAALGPAGLNLLVLDAGFHDDGAGNAAPDYRDVEFFLEPDDTEVRFNLSLGGSDGFETDAIDFGLPALGIESDEGLTVTTSWNLDLGFGLNKTDGFFVITDGDELSFDVDVDLPDALTATLAILRLDLTDNADSGFHAGFSVDVAPGETEVTLSEIGSLLDVEFDFDADLDLDMALRASFDLGQSDPAFFPSIVADLVVDWTFDDDDFATTFPVVEFNDVGLDLGTFFSETLAPVLDQINDVLAPFQPLLDIITSPIPVISDLAGEDISLLDIASALGFAQAGLLQAIADIASLVDQVGDLASSGENIVILFGDFSLAGTNLRDPDALAGVRDPGALDPFAGLGDIADAIDDFLVEGLGGALEDVLGPASPFASQVESLAGGGDLDGFTIPLLSNPAEVFGLLLGRPANVILYDIPDFDFGFEFSQYFPIWGPLGAQVSGSFGAHIDFKVGYDTLGLQQFAEGGFAHPLDIFNGFFVSDRENADGTGSDVPEIHLFGNLAGAAVVNIGVASAGVGGGVSAEVDFNLNDPDADGKVRIPEIVGNVLNGIEHLGPIGPICIFDVHGEVNAHLFAFIEALFGAFRYEFQFGPSLPLIEFDYECPHDPILATDLHDGVLRLNIGPNAGDRLYGNVDDGAEEVLVTHAGGVAGDESVTVTAFGHSETYHGVSHIVANGGAEDDTITFAGVLATAGIEGGFGDDTIDLSTALGAATLTGGVGYDTILGGGGDDVISGEKGNDVLLGGDGADRITGDEGDDVLSGDAGEDVLLAGADDDLVAGGEDADYIDAGAGADVIHGDSAYDVGGVLLALAGVEGSDTVEGGAGNDEIHGEGGDDVLGGGANSDLILGGDGLDEIWGDSTFTEDGTRVAAISGTEGNDTIEGGAGADTIDAEAGSDSVHGNGGNDTVQGGRGADTIYGDDDDDRLFGGSDNDTMFGNAAHDVLAGNAGNDVLFGDDGTVDFSGPDGDALSPDVIATVVAPATDGHDTIGGDGGDDFIFGGAGNDRVAGDVEPAGIAAMVAQFGETPVGHDVVFGDGGRITLSHWSKTLIESVSPGDGGHDTLFGNLGHDTLLGGAGDDDLFGAHGPTFAEAGDDRDVMFGDNGQVALTIVDAGTVFQRSLVATAATTSPSIGGADELLGELESDSILGGAGADVLAGSTGDDVLVGDNGRFDYTLDGLGLATLDLVATTDPLDGGADVITGSAGADIALGGAAGDDLSGATENDVLVGDHGRVELVGGVVALIATTDPAVGGDDTIAGASGDDVGVGGAGGDLISGSTGDDVLVGDNGVVDYDTGDGDLATLDLVETTDHGIGGADVITGADGEDIVLGGTAGDDLSGATENDVLVGDNGRVELSGGALALVRTTDTVNATGGDDTLTAAGGDDVALGGVGDDQIFGSTGADVLVGDNGVVDYDTGDGDLATLDLVATTDETLGGIDLVSGSEGEDIALGGFAGDTILGADADDILLGDNGEVVLAGGALALVRTTDVVAGTGGDDTIEGEAGDDIAMGGVGADTIAGSTGADVLLGDNGTLDWDTGDGDLTTLDLIVTGDPALGGGDLITGSDGADTVMGGAAGDVISGATGADVLIGDGGRMVFAGGLRTLIETIDPAVGGADTIDGNEDGDIVLGGADSDTLSGNAAADVILGDNGRLDYVDGDADATTLDLITTTDPNDGAGDLIFGGTGNDSIAGGTAGDTIFGDEDHDLIFGDHGRIDLDLPPASNFTAIDTGAGDGGFDDTVHGNAGDDTILGQQGDDVLWGDEGDDDMLGGHNVALGADELDGGAVSDVMDGGAGFDVLAGDNAVVVRRGDTRSPLDRVLTGTLLYQGYTGSATDGAAAVTGDAQPNPTGAPGRDITLLDHADTTAAGLSGHDSLAGGAGDDTVFGQLGDDVIQGDGSTAEPVGAGDPSVEAASDGDDYVEGGGGADLIFGNLGQDDLIGGSSDLFGLGIATMRPDGSDTIFGGAGTDIAINDAGDTDATGHARDADMILGDNGRIFRAVGIGSGVAGAFLTFNYDGYSGLRIIPRAIDLLDYSANGNAADDRGAGDLAHGESGDDSIHGASAADTLYGDGQDDDLFGESGNDWISGGAGEDGILGDDGKLFTSRNGTAEPLHGVTPTTERFLFTPGHNLEATLNPAGELKKSVDLEPWEIGGDDSMYGGLGDDSIHGGAGNDGASGAEALAAFYADPASTPIIAFDATTGNFLAFSDTDPLAKIAGHALNFVSRNGATKILDGNDALFGDEGHDWLVGGTQSDHLYGGMGNDIMNADDDLDTSTTDDAATGFDDPDTAFGGGGRDTLIANTGRDRLIDWAGEFNAFYVPFSPYGGYTVNRQILPQFPEFLYALSESDGADQTRVGPSLGSPSRNGEPYGELGLTLQQDPGWHDQTGAPTDPQAGNKPGKKKDVNP